MPTQELYNRPAQMHPSDVRKSHSPRQLVHVEDEFSWRMLVKTSVEAVGNFNLTQFTELEEDALHQIRMMRSRDVVILDLALPNNQETHETVAKILSIAPDLLQRGIYIFIYSAYYPQWKDELERYGIEEKYLFSKGIELDRKKLENTLREIPKEPKRSRAVTTGGAVCNIFTYFGDRSTADDVPSLSPGLSHALTVELVGTMTEEESSHISGKHVRVNIISESGVIRGESGKLHSQSHILTVPEPNKSHKISFDVEFPQESVNTTEKILILFYHNNHLMRKITQYVRVI